MKVYCQFKVLSTGYVQGTIPPQFKEENKRPINMLGSDGVFILDGRKSLDNLIIDSKNRAEKLLQKIVGFEIVQAGSFLDKGKVLYKSYETN